MDRNETSQAPYQDWVSGDAEQPHQAQAGQPATLDSDTIRRLYAALGKEHALRNSHVYGLLHAILATAVSDGILTSNPANLKGVMKPPAKRQAVILNVDDTAKLANAIQPERLKAFILVCGLRFGEIIELRRKTSPRTAPPSP